MTLLETLVFTPSNKSKGWDLIQAYGYPPILALHHPLLFSYPSGKKAKILQGLTSVQSMIPNTD